MKKLLFIPLLAVLSGTAAAGELGAADIRDELVGQTMQWWEADGWRYGRLTLLPDGHARITLDAPSHGQDQGSWRISGNLLCTTWSSLRASETKCYSLERAGTGRFRTSGGNVFEVVAAGV